MGDDNAPVELNNKRERSPSFPYIDLRVAIDHTTKLYRAAKMNEVRVADVASAWDMAPKSGSFLRYVAALGQFGLLDAAGSSANRRYRISSLGRRILEDGRPGVREQLCAEAALMPKLIRGLFLGEDGMQLWGAERPTDSIAESVLKFDLNFTSEAARRFLNVYDETIKFVQIEPEGKLQAAASGNAGNGSSDEDAAHGEEFSGGMQTSERTSYERKPKTGDLELNQIRFMSDGAGIVTIQAKLDADGLDLLEKKIAAFKLLLG